MHSSVALKRQQRQPPHNDINRLLDTILFYSVTTFTTWKRCYLLATVISTFGLR